MHYKINHLFLKHILLSHRVRPVMLRAFAQIATRFSVIFITITGLANSKLCASASLRDVRPYNGACQDLNSNILMVIHVYLTPIKNI